MLLTRFTRTRLAAIFVLIVLIGIVLFSARAVWTNANDHNADYHAQTLERSYQLNLQLVSFERDLTAFGSGIPTTRFTDVQLHFAALQRELTELRAIGFAETVDGTVGASLGRLSDRLDGFKLTIENLDNSVGAQSRALVIALDIRPYLADVADISSRVTRALTEDYQAAVVEIDQISQMAVIISLIAGFAALVLMGWLISDGLEQVRLTRRNARLTTRVEHVSNVRSSFLAMMSHDLRTPLNGLLGGLSLVRALGLSEKQERLLEHADRSGQRLQSILSDVLDFAALQDETLKPKVQLFEPRQLKEDLMAHLLPDAARHNVALVADMTASAFCRVTGDRRLLRQAISHIVLYLLETVGTRAVMLRFGISDDVLTVRLAFSYGKDDVDWLPDLLIGRRTGNMDQVSTDAFGPALARGLLAAMGGEICLDAEEDGLIAIEIRTGARLENTECHRVLLDVESQAVEALCHVGLDHLDVIFLSGADAAAYGVDLVITDAGGALRKNRVALLRTSYPDAILLGVGGHENDPLFDLTLPLPVNGEALQNALTRRA